MKMYKAPLMFYHFVELLAGITKFPLADFREWANENESSINEDVFLAISLFESIQPQLIEISRKAELHFDAMFGSTNPVDETEGGDDSGRVH